ncbi:hypothetical protein [Bartonella elizabethae]|uniref:hypothetical protein n=1 Tax=Bartonella elizabethae TaxID=807 RepID=UPI0002E23ADB|nr:hypothetical protein [Bartonella elizabethae]
MLEKGRGLSSSSNLVKITECDALLLAAVADLGDAAKEFVLHLREYRFLYLFPVLL